MLQAETKNTSKSITRRSVLLSLAAIAGGAAASAAVLPIMPAVANALPPRDATIFALAEKIVELMELDASGAAWRAPLNRLIDEQARSIDGLLAKAHVWEVSYDLEIDDIAFGDLHCSIVADLLNWEVA